MNTELEPLRRMLGIGLTVGMMVSQLEDARGEMTGEELFSKLMGARNPHCEECSEKR